MSDEGPDSLVLGYLRGMDHKLDRIIEHSQDLKVRLSSLDLQLVGLRQDVMRTQQTLDRHSDRLERIERRLDLLPEPAA